MSESAEAIPRLSKRLSFLENPTLWGVFVGGIVLGTLAIFLANPVVLGGFTVAAISVGNLGARILSPGRRRQTALEHIRQGMTIHLGLTSQGTSKATVTDAEELIRVAIRDAANVDSGFARQYVQERDRKRLLEARAKHELPKELDEVPATVGRGDAPPQGRVPPVELDHLGVGGRSPVLPG